MAKGTDCKCGAEMTYIARESDYGDTTAIVYWCPKCGRLLFVNYSMRPEEGDTEEWHEPAPLVLENLKDAVKHELECLKNVCGDYEWTGENSLVLKGNGVIPESTLNAFASRMKRKADLKVTITTGVTNAEHNHAG